MITPALLTKDIKISTSEFIKRDRIFSHFDGWQNGYGAFTYSLNSKDDLIEYVKNQQEHHKVKTFKEEYVELLNEHNIEFDEKYLL